ncbi:MAG: hypothetical protein R3B06_30485 [Kofleriaceae bacterium]
MAVRPRRAPADPLLELNLSLSVRRGGSEINLVGETTVCHDGHRTEFEFDLLDEHGQLLGSRSTHLSIRNGDGVGFADTSLRLEKRVQRAVHAFVLRGRTELRGLTGVGPFRMDAAPVAAVPARKPRAPAPPGKPTATVKLKSVRGGRAR